MIKINLQQRKAAVGAKTSGGLQGMLDKLRASEGNYSAEDQRSGLILLVVYAVILGAGWWFIDEEKLKLVSGLDAELATLDSKINLLNSELNKTNGYEQMKQALEADEKTIRTKITTIQELIRDRSTPPKILTTLSESIPRQVWLQEFSLRDRRFRILGNSDSMDVVSDFMKSLEETVFFKGVVLKSSRQDTSRGGRPNATFELEAERR